MSLEALAPVKEVIRASFFLLFVLFGLFARRSPRAALVFIGYTVFISLLAGLTQIEAWPFSNWALVHTLRSEEMNRLHLIGIDAEGKGWLLDARVVEPLAMEEFDTWLRSRFFQMDPRSQQVIANDLVRRAEQARQRFLAGESPGTVDRILGPLTAPRHFHRPRIWRDRSDVPSVPFRRLRIEREEWNIERLAAGRGIATRRILYESR